MHCQRGSADDLFWIFAGICLISVVFTAPNDVAFVAIIGVALLIMGLVDEWPDLNFEYTPRPVLLGAVNRPHRRSNRLGAICALAAALVASSAIAHEVGAVDVRQLVTIGASYAADLTV